jgi:hypothetical protein
MINLTIEVTPEITKDPYQILDLTDRPVAVTIGKGIWQICDGGNFTGHCFVLNQSVADLGPYRLRGVASVRPWSGAPGAPSAPPSQNDWYIVVFDQPNYRGSPKNYKTAASNIGNMRVQSVTIGKGVWEICEGANFTGRCETLNNSVPDPSPTALMVALDDPERPRNSPVAAQILDCRCRSLDLTCFKARDHVATGVK